MAHNEFLTQYKRIYRTHVWRSNTYIIVGAVLFFGFLCALFVMEWYYQNDPTIVIRSKKGNNLRGDITALCIIPAFVSLFAALHLVGRQATIYQRRLTQVNLFCPTCQTFFHETAARHADETDTCFFCNAPLVLPESIDNIDPPAPSEIEVRTEIPISANPYAAPAYEAASNPTPLQNAPQDPARAKSLRRIHVIYVLVVSTCLLLGALMALGRIWEIWPSRRELRKQFEGLQKDDPEGYPLHDDLVIETAFSTSKQRFCRYLACAIMFGLLFMVPPAIASLYGQFGDKPLRDYAIILIAGSIGLGVASVIDNHGPWKIRRWLCCADNIPVLFNNREQVHRFQIPIQSNQQPRFRLRFRYRLEGAGPLTIKVQNHQATVIMSQTLSATGKNVWQLAHLPIDLTKGPSRRTGEAAILVVFTSPRGSPFWFSDYLLEFA